MAQVPERYLRLLEAAHTRALGPGGEALLEVLCRCLGRMRSEAGNDALSRYLAAESSPRRALAAAKALIRYGDPTSINRVNNAKLRFGPAYDEPLERFLGTHRVAATSNVPDVPGAHAQMATHKLTIKDYAGALADADTELARDPNHVQALGVRALALSNLDRHQEAIQAVQRAVELAPQNARLWNNLGKILEAAPGGRPRAIEAYDRSLGLERTANTLINRAALYKDLRRNDEALRDLNEAIQLDPEQARAYELRGYVHGVGGRIDQAVADFDQAVELDPRRGASWANRGMAYSQQGDMVTALESYDRAIALEPNTAHHRAQRGRIRLTLEDYAGAVEDCTQALRLDPRRAEARVYRADALHELGKPAEARRDLEEALRVLPPGHPNRGEAERMLRALEGK